MYRLTNLCYVCLKKKNNLTSSVNSSVSVNEELHRIISYYRFNLPWLKTKQIILTCEECYSLLRETYKFLKMWHKNSALLRGYTDLLNNGTMSNAGNAAEPQVHVNIKQTDIKNVKREVKLDGQIYTFQWVHNIEKTEDALVDFEDSLVKEIIYKKKNVNETEAYPTVNYSTEITEETKDVFCGLLNSPCIKEENTSQRMEVDVTEECPTDNNSTALHNIEETNCVFVNVEDSFVKEENTWKREEVDDTEEYPMGNNSTKSIDNESNSEISLSDNLHLTNTDSVSSGFAGKQLHATNKDDLNTATTKSYKCSTCSKSFITKTELIVHTRIHIDNKSIECDICKMRFNRKANLEIHMRVHTGEKPYKCATCEKCFSIRSILLNHMRTHTGEKPYECATCKKCFATRSTLTYHRQTHTIEKPYECATCRKRYILHSQLVRHLQTHTGEKPFECVTCKKSFTTRSSLVSHMRVHTDEKPYKCSKCNECFRHKTSIKIHLRNKHPDEEQH